MFHPHFFRLFFGNPHSIADTTHLVSAFEVGKELEDARAREKADPTSSSITIRKLYKAEVYYG